MQKFMASRQYTKGVIWLPLIAILLSLFVMIVLIVLGFMLSAMGSKLSTKVDHIEGKLNAICTNDIPHLSKDVNNLNLKFDKFDERMTNIEDGINNLSKEILDNFEKLFQRLPDSQQSKQPSDTKK